MLLARRVDWSEIRRVLSRAEWWPLVLAVVALGADMTARITRWCWMLRAAEPGLPLASCVRPFLGSLALNNTVPLRAGDVVRVVGFRQALRAPLPHVAGTLVLERLLDLLVLLGILFAALAGTSGALPHGFLVAAGLAGAGTITLLLGLTLFPRAIPRLVGRALATLGSEPRWLPVANRVVAQLSSALALLRSPARAVRLLTLSVLAWVLEGAVFACVAWSLHLAVPLPASWLSLGA